MTRPEWVKCIERSPGRSFCGRTLMEFMFVDLGHANRAVDAGSRLVPCRKCFVKATEAVQ